MTYLDDFTATVQALLEIRDARLYRETHATFEGYCRERWALSPRAVGALDGVANDVARLKELANIDDALGIHFRAGLSHSEWREAGAIIRRLADVVPGPS